MSDREKQKLDAEPLGILVEAYTYMYNKHCKIVDQVDSAHEKVENLESQRDKLEEKLDQLYLYIKKHRNFDPITKKEVKNDIG